MFWSLINQVSNQVILVAGELSDRIQFLRPTAPSAHNQQAKIFPVSEKRERLLFLWQALEPGGGFVMVI